MKKITSRWNSFAQCSANREFFIKRSTRPYLETSGSISINKNSFAEPPTAKVLQMEVGDEDPTILLVDGGSAQEDMLEFIGKSKDWLYEQLNKEGCPDPNNVANVEWSEANSFFYKEILLK